MRFDSLSIRQIEYLLILAQEQNFTSAAEKLFISQPTLSQTVHRIEDENHITLFNRDKKQGFLTEEGLLFVRFAENIYRHMTELNSQLALLEQSRSCTLSLGVGYALGNIYLSKKLSMFRKAYPNVKISLVEASSAVLEQKSVDSEIDIAFVLLPLQTLSLPYIPLQDGEIVLTMSKSNPLNEFSVSADDGGLDWFDLHKCVNSFFVRSAVGNRTELLAEQLLRSADFTPKLSMRVRNTSTAVRIVSQSNDLLIAPDLYLFSEDANTISKINMYRILGNKLKWTLVAVLPHGEAGMSRPAQDFIHLLER